MMTLEGLVEAGRINLKRLTDKALLKDYQSFRYDKVVGQALLREIMRRTERASWLEKEDIIGKFTLILEKDHWLLVNGEGEYADKTEGQYPIDTDTLWTFNPSPKEIALIRLYEFRAKIANLIYEIKEVQREVRKNPDKAHSLWNRMYSAQKELERIDPYNKALDYGIYGLPFDKRLVD